MTLQASEVWTPKNVARKALTGAIALGARQVIVLGLGAIGSILLARILSPQEFGLFAIVTFVVNFLMVFGDVGLGASLIRQSDEPTMEDYRAVFTVQQGLVTLVVVLFWFVAPLVARAYHLPPRDAWIFRLAALSLFFTSFQVVPSLILERRLAFSRLAVIEGSQAFVYYSVAVGLAWRGFGVLSFALALLLRSVVGALLALRIGRWRMGWRWNRELIWRHLRFGLPYQGTLIVSLLKDTVIPVFIGFVAGTVIVGYINWATVFANYPIIAGALLNRLYLPVFARLAGNPVAFRRALSVVVALVCAVAYTASALLFVFRYDITRAVFGAKWEPALALFLPFTLINLLLAPTVIAQNALNALGDSLFVFRLMVLWMVSLWVFGAAALLLFDWTAFGWANLAVNLFDLLALSQVTRLTGFGWLGALVRPAAIALAAGGTGALLKIAHLPWPVALVVAAGGAAIIGAKLLLPEFTDIFRSWKTLPE